MSRHDRIRITILVLIALGTMLLAFKMHRTAQRADDMNTEIGALMQQREQDLDVLRERLLRAAILQTHLDECFEYDESTLNHVERDPCRFICATMEIDELWSSELDEAICGDLQ